MYSTLFMEGPLHVYVHVCIGGCHVYSSCCLRLFVLLFVCFLPHFSLNLFCKVFISYIFTHCFLNSCHVFVHYLTRHSLTLCHLLLLIFSFFPPFPQLADVNAIGDEGRVSDYMYLYMYMYIYKYNNLNLELFSIHVHVHELFTCKYIVHLFFKIFITKMANYYKN